MLQLLGEYLAHNKYAINVDRHENLFLNISYISSPPLGLRTCSMLRLEHLAPALFCAFPLLLLQPFPTFHS